jgi:hypothetical protein
VDRGRGAGPLADPRAGRPGKRKAPVTLFQTDISAVIAVPKPPLAGTKAGYQTLTTSTSHSTA